MIFYIFSNSITVYMSNYFSYVSILNLFPVCCVAKCCNALFLKYTNVVSWIRSLIRSLILIPLSNMIILKPAKLDAKAYDKLLTNPHIINEKIHTSDGEILDAMFYNMNKVPKYDDVIYMYSHGNSGWTGLILESTSCDYLANYGSVFVYDYRGYGKSTGKPSCDGCLKDCIEVYFFLVNIKKVNPKNIILYGHSLGACVTSYLVDYLVQNFCQVPSHMIIQNAFENIERLCDEIIPFSGKLISGPLQTNKYLKNIDKTHNIIDICIIHGKDDKLIHFSHSIDLANQIKNNNVTIILLNGTHDILTYDNAMDNYLNKLCNKLYKFQEPRLTA